MYRAIVQIEAAYAASAAVIHWQKPTKEVLVLSLKEKFNREFQPVLESISLPERLAGRYTPESCVACREDGEVWLLRDGADSRFILKIDRTGERDLAGEFALTRHLPRELRVPQPVDCFQEGGIWYLLRTYLPGQPLSEVWEPGDAGRCVELGQKLCAVLERLHDLEEPVIHRDIKPENIILTPEREPGLIDFGIARTYKEGQGSDTMFMGTRNTAPPEQYGYAQTDRRADIYSLGVTLRWMLTGSYRPEAMERGNYPEGLKRCLRKATAFDPQNRYGSAGELGRALSASLKPQWRKWLLPIACLALILVLAALWWPRQETGIAFDSALLEQAVRAELDKPEGTITSEDLGRVERLAVVGKNLLGAEQNYIYTIFGYVDGVPQLDAPNGDISDLSLLSRMPNLKTLYLCQQEIGDLSPLAGLPLEELYLADNHITDLSPLETLSNLQVLCLGSNPANDLTPLSSLSRLRELNLDSQHGAVDSFTPLAQLHLRELHLCNQFPADGDWSFLGTLDEVTELWLWHQPIEALEVLPDMKSLQKLSIGEMEGEHLRLLSAVGLESLSLFGVTGSLDGLEQMEDLRWLDLAELEGVSLEPMAALKRLSFLSLNNCRRMDYTPLLRIPALKTVDVWSELCRQELERDCPQGARTFEII